MSASAARYRNASAVNWPITSPMGAQVKTTYVTKANRQDEREGCVMSSQIGVRSVHPGRPRQRVERQSANSLGSPPTQVRNRHWLV